MQEKPFVQLTGNDGNAYAIMGSVVRALKQAGQKDKAKEFTEKAMASPSYNALLVLCTEYVEVG